MTNKKFFRNKYKCLLYKTPMGQVVAWLIDMNMDDLVNTVSRIESIKLLAPPEEVARDILAALTWEYGITREGQKVRLTVKGCGLDGKIAKSKGSPDVIFEVVDEWLENLLVRTATDVRLGWYADKNDG